MKDFSDAFDVDDDDDYRDDYDNTDVDEVDTGTISTVDNDDDTPKKSQGTMLVEMALEHYELGCTIEGVPFAVPSGSHIVRMLRGGKVSLRAELSAAYYERFGVSPGSTGVADALRVLEGLAMRKTPTETYLRVARFGNTVYVDTADDENRVIIIDAAGWRIMVGDSNIPVRFHRTELTLPIDTPERGGDLDELWSFMNVAERDRPLVAAWLVSAYVLEGFACPVCALKAQQGSAKTTTGWMLTNIVDPTPLEEGSSSPTAPDRWHSIANGSRVIFIDNISTIPDWFSDSLCRAVTGSAETKRTLYTDSNNTIVRYRRAIILNGIDFGAVRGDLADRLLMLDVRRIDPRKRRAEKDLKSAWVKSEPRILGAVLDLASQVLATVDGIRLETLPRMADFAYVVAAVDNALGTDALGTYLDKAETLALEVVESSPFICAIQKYVTDHGRITGMASGELYATITNQVDVHRDTRSWPKSPRGASDVLNRYAPELRKLGWTVEDEHDKRVKRKLWTIDGPPN